MEEKRRKRDVHSSSEKKRKRDDDQTKSIQFGNCQSSQKSNGTAVSVPAEYSVKSASTPLNEHESVGVDELEVEIERQLEEKAEKSKLTAINVKTILKAVITNKDVVEMVSNEIKGATTNTYGPKLTRAKTKELLEPYSVEICQPLAPKKKSECAFLLHEELPEEETDDEYNPHESSDTESKASELLPESPFPSPFVQYENTTDDILNTSYNADENIGQRTRSKFSLSETPLETIERQFIPPDVTTDMYDTECDNEDWLEFLKGIQNPVDKCPENVEDENDPEYNIMKDEEFDALDFEELRHDRGVKVTKKELHNLMNEWFGCEGPYSSEEDENENKDSCEKKEQHLEDAPVSQIDSTMNSPQKTSCSLATTVPLPNEAPDDRVQEPVETVLSTPNKPINLSPVVKQVAPLQVAIPRVEPVVIKKVTVVKVKSYFTYNQLCLLKQQMEQHVQLLLQSYLLTYKHPFIDDKISYQFKQLILTLCSLGTNDNSIYSRLTNLKSSKKLVEEWELFLANPVQNSAISKFIYQEHMKADKNRKSKYMPEIPKELMDFCSDSTAFVYPLLLPEHGCRFPGGRNDYSTQETDLIAFGLAEFSIFLKEAGETPNVMRLCNLLNTYLMPSRSAKSIMDHIIVMKKHRGSNSIKRYFKLGEAPVMSHYVITYNRALKLRDHPLKLLPPKWRSYFSKKKSADSTNT